MSGGKLKMRKRKWSRIAVPLVQVALMLSAVIWYNIAWRTYAHNELARGFADLPGALVIALNFPLAVLWFPILFVLGLALSTSSLGISGGAVFVVLVAIVDTAIISIVALFWYFVVVEIEMRTNGNSLVRFRTRTVEALKSILFAVAGFSSVSCAYWDCHRALLYGHGRGGAAIIVLLLVAWAIMLVTVAVQDFLFAKRNEAGRHLTSRDTASGR